jgi:hypothetical protein
MEEGGIHPSIHPLIHPFIPRLRNLIRDLTNRYLPEKEKTPKRKRRALRAAEGPHLSV